MAVGVKAMPPLGIVAGVRLGTVAAGIRKADRRDLVVIQCDPGTTAAAVFTQSHFAAAPVIVAKAHWRQTEPRALIINTGYANAATGEPGLADAHACCQALAQALGCRPDEVLPFSTGVIGERLPAFAVIAAIPAAVSAASADGWGDAAHGIMTTDTVPKGATREIAMGGKSVRITGIAKGSGMIHPNMATMLSFVATDIEAARPVLQAALSRAVKTTFNAISVDGDTSTNDALVVLATGRSGVRLTAAEGPAFSEFCTALEQVCGELAQAIVRDGEGATKFVRVEISGAKSDDEARAVADTIATSPLVKTALFASDPNWGRILMAVGRAPIALDDPNRVTVSLNGVRVFCHGAVDPDYREEVGQKALAAPDITVGVDLGQGAGRAVVHTCDFSYDYVRINGSYRT
ncbi:bifunctional glutamate N-acetyltransferase/amino-acid acetyltransferase ArgJ [Acidiferrobacter sp.]|uniref:bifunctional glutamate N-acetyltransferase/amino-acid acetyltransferase ArgJ n=1 Tax=Acidiferrobacter sp. TaxID=1872107 RepID=UPI002621380B|nr:bifunctional glutamate N-acetyltransferase/amino-acid acetyltransferase ArgJ [Acidiferrobacter sp.]